MNKLLRMLGLVTVKEMERQVEEVITEMAKIQVETVRQAIREEREKKSQGRVLEK